MTLSVLHSTPSDGTFSAAGALAWDANHSLSGIADVSQGGTGAATFPTGAVLYGNGPGTLQTDATHLFYDSVNHGLAINAGALLASTNRLYVNGEVQFPNIVFRSSAVNGTIQNNTATGILSFQTVNAATGNSGGFSATTGNSTLGNAGGIAFLAGTGRLSGGSIDFQSGDSSTGPAGNINLVTGIGSGGGDINLQPTGTAFIYDNTATVVAQTDPGGSGLFMFGNYAAGVVVPTGSIQIMDLGGTVRTIPCL